MLPEGRGSGGHLEGPWQQTILFDTQHPTPVALPSPGRSSEGFSLSLHKCPGSKCWGLLGPYHFCPLSSPSLHEMFLGISDFLEEISSLSHSVVFLYFLH